MATNPRRLLGIILAATVVFGAAACGGGTPRTTPSSGAAASGHFPVTLADDDGVKVTMNAPPQRIVTFSPSDTEIVFALGLGDRLVGVSGPSDDYPPAAKSITQVGAGQFGTDLNVEKVVSLHADLVLYTFGTAPWMTQARKVGIPVFTTHATSIDDTMHDIDTLGRLLGASTAASALTAKMRRDAATVEQTAAKQPAESCFYEVGYNPLYTVGPGSLEYDLLQRAGCDPVTSGGKSAYPQWSVEALLKEDPAVYLVASESATSEQAVTKRPGYDGLTAVKEGRIALLDSSLISRPGPRLVEGLALLAKDLHPEAFG